MKLALSMWFSLVLFLGVITRVQLVSPPCKTPCGDTKNDLDRPTKCPGRLICQPGEVLVDSPPCCEPTCCDNCSNVQCPLIFVRKPSCVCKPGLVRYKGVCIAPCDCPPKEIPPMLPPVPVPAPINDDIPYQGKPAVFPTHTSPPVNPPCGSQQNTPPPPCQVAPKPCPCHGAAVPPSSCQCYPPPPVAPPSPCGKCYAMV